MGDQGSRQAAPAQGASGAGYGYASGMMGFGARGSSHATSRPDEPDAQGDTDTAGWKMGHAQADVWRGDGDSGGMYEADAYEMPHSGEAAQVTPWRLKVHQQLREFLRAVPRSEADATLVLVRPDGSTRLYTRAELSAAIDRLRPRQRQILRLSLEERWSRQRICEYLRHISLKTFERDQGEGLDILAQM